MANPGALTLSAYSAAAGIDAVAWDRLAATADPFVGRGFLGNLEIHGAVDGKLGWMPCHLGLADNEGTLAGLAPTYVKTNAFGDFLRDWSWPEAFARRGIAYFPKLVTGIPYTPATGHRLLAASDDVRRQLIRGVIELVRARGLSSWHVAFPRPEEAALLDEAGLLAQHNVQFHWFNRGYTDFDDYLATFTSAKRRKLRADRRKVAEAGVTVRMHTGTQVPAELWPHLHAFYAATFRRYGNHPALSAECWAALGAALGERMVVFVAFRDRQPLAVAFCFRGDDVLFGRYWGAAEEIPGLHFELCYYQGIDYCIRHGVQRFEPGAGGEHKLARGFEPVRVGTWHWIADPFMRDALRRHLERVADSVEEYRQAAEEHLPFRL